MSPDIDLCAVCLAAAFDHTNRVEIFDTATDERLTFRLPKGGVRYDPTYAEVIHHAREENTIKTADGRTLPMTAVTLVGGTLTCGQHAGIFLDREIARRFGLIQ